MGTRRSCNATVGVHSRVLITEMMLIRFRCARRRETGQLQQRGKIGHASAARYFQAARSGSALTTSENHVVRFAMESLTASLQIVDTIKIKCPYSGLNVAVAQDLVHVLQLLPSVPGKLYRWAARFRRSLELKYIVKP